MKRNVPNTLSTDEEMAERGEPNTGESGLVGGRIRRLAQQSSSEPLEGDPLNVFFHMSSISCGNRVNEEVNNRNAKSLGNGPRLTLPQLSEAPPVGWSF